MTWAMRPTGDAETRVLRTIVTILGVTTVVFLALTIDGIVAQWPYVQPVWSVFAVGFVFGVPPLLAVAGFALDARVIRLVCGVYAIATLAIMVGYLPAMTSGLIPAGMAPWPLSIATLCTVPAAAAFRPPMAWSVLASSAVVIAVVREFATASRDLPLALQDALSSFAFGTIFTALALVSLRSARALDVAAITARAAAVRRAAGMAGQREKTRLDALLHDDVMTTLYYASQGNEELDAAVRRQARHALTELARVGGDGAAPVEVSVFTSRIRSVSLQYGGTISFSVVGRRTGPIPAEIDDAFAEATGEAVRNSLIHAARDGRAVTRSTTGVLSEERVVVRIEDDGVGFEARDVRPRRLGIVVSIRRRMAGVPGGSARIQSTPGRGVLVHLQWRQP